jgi:hypothetical protein
MHFIGFRGMLIMARTSTRGCCRRLVWLIGFLISSGAWSFQPPLYRPTRGITNQHRRPPSLVGQQRQQQQQQHQQRPWPAAMSITGRGGGEGGAIRQMFGGAAPRIGGSSRRSRHNQKATTGLPATTSSAAAAGLLLDVALDVPLPIYFAATTASSSTRTGAAAAAAAVAAILQTLIPRLLLVLVGAIVVSPLLRHKLVEMVTTARWFPAARRRVAQMTGLAGGDSSKIEGLPTMRTVVPPLETYIPSSSARRETTTTVVAAAVMTKPITSLLEEEEEEILDDDDVVVDSDDVADDDDDDDDAGDDDIVRDDEDDDSIRGETDGNGGEEEEGDDDDDTNTMAEGNTNTAMLFVDEGWGQVRFVAKEQVPDSTLIKLSFALPRPTDYLPLAVGEKVRLCGIVGAASAAADHQDDDEEEEGDDEIVYEIDAVTPLVAEVYPYGDASSGQFSFLVEDPSLIGNDDDDDIDEEEKEAAQLVRTILDEFAPGDELAIQPAIAEDAVLERIAPWQLSQNNIHTVLYWANGSGISPAMDHVRIILDEDDSSGVQNVNLLWVNNAVSDFTYAENDLEEQYERHGDRLAIACIAEDSPSASDDIAAALIPFAPGVLAVLSGPRSYTADAAQFLMDSQGFPAQAICIL